MINEKLNKNVLELINVNKLNIEKISGNILWTNKNPNDMFDAKNIEIDLSSYDTIAIYGKLYNGASGIQYLGSCSKSSYLKIMNEVWVEGIGESIAMRNINVSNTTIEFGNVNLINLSTGLLQDNPQKNNFLIPIYIIGFNTDLYL